MARLRRSARQKYLLSGNYLEPDMNENKADGVLVVAGDLSAEEWIKTRSVKTLVLMLDAGSAKRVAYKISAFSPFCKKSIFPFDFVGKGSIAVRGADSVSTPPSPQRGLQAVQPPHSAGAIT
jgi:hypothetical protein